MPMTTNKQNLHAKPQVGFYRETLCDVYSKNEDGDAIDLWHFTDERFRSRLLCQRDERSHDEALSFLSVRSMDERQNTNAETAQCAILAKLRPQYG